MKHTPDQLLLFCPAGHHIPDVAALAAMVKNASSCAQQGAIVTFGVVPAFPSTGYGYLERGNARAGCGHGVERFIEKPNAAFAQELLLAGNVLWNAGIFLCTSAEVTRGKETFLLSENQSTYIPLGEVHRLHNPGKTPLEMIEVQSGSYLGEDDRQGVCCNFYAAAQANAPASLPPLALD